MSVSEAQRRASAKYIKENIKHICLQLNKKTDKDIIDKLSSEENMQGYIKSLIRKDMER